MPVVPAGGPSQERTDVVDQARTLLEPLVEVFLAQISQCQPAGCRPAGQLAGGAHEPQSASRRTGRRAAGAFAARQVMLHAPQRERPQPRAILTGAKVL